MGIVRFAQDIPSGKYIIVGTTDEELYVIAELLLDREAVAGAQLLIDTIGQDSARTERFYLKKRAHNQIFIQFYDNEKPLAEDNPLEISLSLDNLDHLIDAWEQLTLERPPQLVLSRRHDSDTVEIFVEHV